MNCEASNTKAEAVESAMPETPATPVKKKKSKASKSSSSSSGKAAHDALQDSSASLDLKDSPKKSSSSKKKSSSSSKSHGSSKSKLESSKSKLDASASSLVAEQDNHKHEEGRKSSKKSSSSKKKDSKAGGEVAPNPDQHDDDDQDKIITLLTKDFWKQTESADDMTSVLSTLQGLLQADDKAKQNYQKNRHITVQLGAPLLVVTQMKQHVNHMALQTTGLHILQSWMDMNQEDVWYVLVAVGVMECIQTILQAETTDTNAALQQHALTIVAQYLVPQPTTAVAAMACIQTLLRTSTTSANATLQAQALKGAVDHFLTTVQIGSTTTTTSTVDHGALMESIQAILQAQTTDENRALQDQALTAVEGMVANPTTAKIWLQSQGVPTLRHVVTGRNGALIPRALEALTLLCTTAGTAARQAVTEHTGEILRDSPIPQLQSAIVSLWSEILVGSGDDEGNGDAAETEEERAKGLLQGMGVDTLVYAYEAYTEDRPEVSEKAFDLLLLLASKGGAASRQAIVKANLLDIVVQRMKAKPTHLKVQQRSCLFVTLMAEDQKQVIQESDILPLVSKVFDNLTEDTDEVNAVRKEAQRALDASSDSDAAKNKKN